MNLASALIAAPKSLDRYSERRLHAIECVAANVMNSHRGIPSSGHVESSQKPDWLIAQQISSVIPSRIDAERELRDQRKYR